MRAIRLPLRHSVFFLTALAIALILFLPLRLVLGGLGVDRIGLSARKAEGSIWFGRLGEARIGDAPLGDLATRLSPIPLLVGRARIDLSSRDESAPPMKGALSLSRARIGIDDATAIIPAAVLFAPLPVEALDLTDVSVHFADGQCDHAEGQVRARLSGDIAGLNLAQGLTGNARCVGGVLLLPLQSQSGMERLSLRVKANGSYALDFSVRATDPAIAPKLAIAGFRQMQDQYIFSLAGRF